ncbi:hypothetical protein L914_02898, partial [Phytophthora nicotianae]
IVFDKPRLQPKHALRAGLPALSAHPMAQQWATTGEHGSAPVSDPPTLRTPENMFRMKGAHKPQMWDFIRLVRKDEYSHIPQDDLISDNAKGAHCLKCGVNIPYTKGTTNYVRYHMATRHPGHMLTSRPTRNSRALSSHSSALQATPLSQPVTHQNLVAGERLYDPESDPTIPRTPENMFRMKGAHKPQMWDFIRLVRKDECAHIPQDNLVSDNAVSAHCLKCGKNIPYSKGNTNKVKQHMKVRHADHLSAARPSLRLTNSLTRPNVLETIPSHQTQVMTTEQSSADVVEVPRDPTIPRTPENMFRMKGAHKPELWDFIRLVRKDEFSGVAKDDLISDNAKSAHCLKCGVDIPYKKGLTNNVKSHMAIKHSRHLEAAQERRETHKSGVSFASQRRPSTIPPRCQEVIQAPVPEVVEISVSPDRPEAKAIAPAQQAHANKLLATWLAQSRRPLSNAEDVNLVAYLKHVSEAFGGVKMKMPSQVQLRAIVMDIDDQYLPHTDLQRSFQP